MKKIFILSSLIAVTLATPSFAEPTELDKKTVASKAYVDTKQDKITTGLVEFNGNPDFMLPAITTYDSTSGLVANKIGILDWQTADDVEGPLNLFSYAAGGYGSEMDNFVPTVRAVAESIHNIWDNMPYWAPLAWNNTQSTAINAYNSTFGNGTNNWTGNATDLINGQFLANSLALKQNKIPAATEDYQSVLIDTDNDGVVGKMQIITADYLDSAGIYLYDLGYASSTIPTSGAIAFELVQYQIKLPAAWTGTTNPGTMASMGGQTIDLTATQGEVGQRYITAGGSQPLTQKAGADNVILYINGTKTLAQYQTSNFGANSTTANQNYIKGALVSLELLKDVYSALHNEIQNATPTGTPGNVAMYDATTGALGDGVATYSGATAQNPYNATNDAAKIATAAAVETKQTKRVCAGYEPGHENDPDYCWLWDFPD